MMKIASARVIVTCPGRNFVTLKLTTNDGLTGVGDATLNGRELAVASYLEQHICPLLIGRDAHRIEDTWHYLYEGGYWRRGPVTMASISAVDTALWDIKGKVAGLPVYQLLGGRVRDGIDVYGHANGQTIPEVLEEVARFVELGYKAVRIQSGVPGIDDIYGVSDDKLSYEPATAQMPANSNWSSERYLAFIPKAFEAVRERFGFDLHIPHDIHHRLRPIEAAQLGKRLEEYAPYWLEDPAPAELQEGFRLIRQHTTAPIAVGEVFNSVWDCHRLIAEQLIDYIRTSVTHAGGITHLRRIFSLAELYSVRAAPHGATDLSPVCLAAGLHLDICTPNFGLQEYMPHNKETDEVFRHSYRFADGRLHPGEEPGLGVDIDESLASRYDYRPAYLPINRLFDGTVHSW
jgi:mannonate dehydratase